jgi:hypothetical protein
MPGEVLIAVALLAIFTAAALYHSRGTLVLAMLVPGSQMFGLLDPMVFAVRGVLDIHLLIMMLCALVGVCAIGHARDFREAKFKRYILILGLLWIYGVIYPVSHGYSSLFLALKASKEFMTLFVYATVFLFLRTQQDVEAGWKVLIAFGILYSLIELAGLILGRTVLELLHFHYWQEGRYWKVLLPFWPVILIACLHGLFLHVLGLSRAYGSLLVCTFGLFLTFFRSYVLATLAVAPVVQALGPGRLSTLLSRGSVALASVAMVTLFAVVLVGGSGVSFGKVYDTFIGSGLAELRSQRGGSLEGREVFANERRRVLAMNPNFGFGFVDREAIGWLHLEQKLTGDHLGFIDKGDVDTAITFGRVGRVVLYGTFAALAIRLIRMARRTGSPQMAARCLALASTIGVFLVVQPVHAPLTYSFGLLPLGIGLGLLEREALLRRAESA